MRNLSILGCAVALAALTTSTTAHAGGVGIVGNGGFRGVPAYYYRSDGLQGIDRQNRPSFGAGIEAVLGDRDNKILGIGRVYTVFDSPPLEPDTSGEDQTYVYTYPAAHEEGTRTIGVLTVGAQWGVYGDPTGFQVVLSTMLGSSFATPDSLEFLLAEPGAGVTYTIDGRIQTFAVAAYSMRFRKSVSHGANGYLGVRYLFD